MSTGVITSFTLIDFPSESEMTAFFVFIEKHTDALANELRANGMIKFYVTRVFNKEGKFTVGNWLEYKDAESYKACDSIWAKFMTEKAYVFLSIFLLSLHFLSVCLCSRNFLAISRPPPKFLEILVLLVPHTREL